MNYYIVTRDLQGGEFGMNRCYTAREWGEQAFEWADSDGSEEPEYWLLENYKSEQDLIDDIADFWELRFAKLDEKQKQKYGDLLEEIDIAGSNFYSAELRHDTENQKKYQTEYYKLYDELDKFYKEVEGV